MNKLISLVTIGLLGLVVLTTAGPIFIELVSSLVPLVLVVGVVVACLRLVWFYTGGR